MLSPEEFSDMAHVLATSYDKLTEELINLKKENQSLKNQLESHNTEKAIERKVRKE